MTKLLKSPYPYFGGKGPVMQIAWQAMGWDVPVFLDPFMGSNAPLLHRPRWDEWQPRHNEHEIVNDLDGFIVNFWRAVQRDPEAVARYANAPVYESELHARHAWLVNQASEIDLPARLEGDPEYCHAKIAGYWVWGLSLWIGKGFASGKGGWRVVDGRLRKVKQGGNGISRQLPNLTSLQGVLRMGDGDGQRVASSEVNAKNIAELVARMPSRRSGNVFQYMLQLAERMRDVKVLCGDWKRFVASKSVCPALLYATGSHWLKTTAIFLDPPYNQNMRNDSLYTHESRVSSDVRDWAIANGSNPYMRIVLCGYEGEHDMPPDWGCYAWSANGGYANHGDGRGKLNKRLERIWFSPHCLPVTDVPKKGRYTPPTDSHAPTPTNGKQLNEVKSNGEGEQLTLFGDCD